MVSHPSELAVAEGENVHAAFKVVDSDGTATLVSFFAGPGGHGSTGSAQGGADRAGSAAT
jgi:hypothetical protein